MGMKKGTFNGTAQYAKNKRQQVVITDVWAEAHPEIYFCTVHPGWSDTPAVRSAMPDFYEKMKDKLRTAEEGGDCITFGVAARFEDLGPNGSFYTDREVQEEHLTMAFTKESKEDRVKLTELLDKLFTETL